MFCFHYRLIFATINTMHGEKMHEEIRGQVERITYFNEENNYTIAKVRIQGGNYLLCDSGRGAETEGTMEQAPVIRGSV